MTQTDQNEFLQTVVESLSTLDPDDFEKALDELRKLSNSPLRTIFASLLDDPDPELALGVVRAIGALECTDATDLLIGLIDEPGRWFTHADRDAVRFAAVESLGLTRDPRGIDALLGLLKPGGDPLLELEAVKALGLIGSPSSVRPLLRAMTAYPPVALSAAGVVARIGGEEAFRGLLAGLRHEVEMVRSASIWALGELGDERALGPLMECMLQADPLLRSDIVWAVGRIGGHDAMLALEGIQATDPDPIVRREAARALRPDANADGKDESKV